MFPYTITTSKVLVLHYKPQFSDISAINIEYECSDEKIDIDIRYSYSYDGVNWSPYFIDETKFLQEFSEIGYSFAQVMFKIRIETIIPQADENLGTLQEDGKYVENIFDIDKSYVTISAIKVVKTNGNIITEPTKVEMLNTDSVLVKTDNLWNPYFGMELAFDILENISSSVNKIFGHWVYYFRTAPSENEKSVTFKQYNLLNVVDMKLVKVLVPENIFPSNRNIYSEWGIALPDEFTVHIVLAEFAKAFGYGAVPNENDYMFMPISGKMYDINSCFEDKSFMQRAVKYDCILVKHEKQEKIETHEFTAESFINYVMNNDEETHSQIEENIASPNIMNLITVDAYRLSMHKELEIVEYPLTVDGVEIFRNMYKLNSVKSEEPVVSYSMKKYIFQNISVNWWMMQLSKRSGKLFAFESGTEFLIISCKRGKLHINYLGAEFESKELPTNVMLACSISFSNQYNFLSLTVFSYIDGEFEQLFDEYIEVQAYNIPVELMKVFNASVLISNIAVNKSILETDMFLNKLTESLPVNEDNIVFDKAVKPSGETEFSL